MYVRVFYCVLGSCICGVVYLCLCICVFVCTCVYLCVIVYLRMCVCVVCVCVRIVCVCVLCVFIYLKRRKEINVHVQKKFTMQPSPKFHHFPTLMPTELEY